MLRGLRASLNTPGTPLKDQRVAQRLEKEELYNEVFLQNPIIGRQSWVVGSNRFCCCCPQSKSSESGTRYRHLRQQDHRNHGRYFGSPFSYGRPDPRPARREFLGSDYTCTTGKGFWDVPAGNQTTINHMRDDWHA